jgi:hypothetical protein
MSAVLTEPTSAPMLFFPEVGMVAAKSRTVISVSPTSYTKQYIYDKFPTYTLASAEKGKFVTLKIYDHQAWVQDRSTLADDSEGMQAEYQLMPIRCTDVAEDFIRNCVSGSASYAMGFKPGIVLCAGDVATDEEVKQAFAQHDAYARFMVNEGHSLFNKQDFKGITEEMRRCAEYLGAAVPWLNQLERTNMKKCAACAEEIKAEALVCMKCNTFLPDFYKQYGLNTQDDAAVHHFIAIKKDSLAPNVPLKNQGK